MSLAFVHVLSDHNAGVQTEQKTFVQQINNHLFRFN